MVVVEHWTNEKYTTLMASSFKKTKRNLSESSSESDNEEITRFPRFIVLEAQDDSPLATLSLFIIEKIISSNLQPKAVKKLRNGNLLVEVEKKKLANFLLKMKTFHKKIIAYSRTLHQNLNTSKGVVRSQELSLCPLEEIK